MQQGATMSGVTMGIYLVAMIAIFYFLLIRPQKKREKEARMMLESLVVGDKIITIGGVQGKITQIKDDTITIETGALNNRSSITFSRSAIKEIVKKAESKQD